MKSPRLPLAAILLLILPVLACRAAARLVDTALGTAVPSHPAPQAAVPTPASCPGETAAIMRAAQSETPISARIQSIDTGDDPDVPLVYYPVSGDALGSPTLESVPKNLKNYQQDVTDQKSAWRLFTTLIPPDQRQMLRGYAIITDGPGGILSAVEQTETDPNGWVLEMDVADIPDTKNLVFTLIHEFGHLLTLNASQVPPDLQVFNHPGSQRILAKATNACPNYFPGEGCSLPTSYINVFFDRFWRDLYEEWNAIDRIQNAERHDTGLDNFYRKYRDRFIDSYAVTDPEEDIAETWAFFVLNPRPQGSSIADQKIQFFYGYPELVQLRGQILNNLCGANP